MRPCLRVVGVAVCVTHMNTRARARTHTHTHTHAHTQSHTRVRYGGSEIITLFEPENSAAMGFGFRCGFLGLLHMDVCQTRLEREFDLDIIATAPSVVYQVSHPDRNTCIQDIRKSRSHGWHLSLRPAPIINLCTHH